MIGALTEAAKITLVKPYVSAGVTNITDATIIDMAGYDAVAFVAIGDTPSTGTAAVTMKVEQGDASDLSAASDLVGSIDSYSIANDATEQALVLDYVRPSKRYVRCVVERADQDIIIGGILAIQYSARERAVTQDSTVEYETTANPSEA